jgi:nicotinate-nucleotide adenylyltransferase
MVRLAISDNPLFKFDDRELQRARESDSTSASYTIDTLDSLRDELGDEVSLVLLMGSDAFTKFNTWHRWEEIIQRCHITLVQRPLSASIATKENLPKVLETFLHNHYTENGDDLHSTAAGFVIMQHITALEISATAIRHTLEQKNSARYLLPETVVDYIQQHNLYQHSEN